MRQLFIKQKVFSLNEKFTVKDEQQQDVYFIEGSLFKIPKTFTMMDENGQPLALIKKKLFSWLPQFSVEINGEVVLTIKKELSFFKARYSIDAAGIVVHGNWWDMDFEIFQAGERVGKVSKEWFTWGDSYKVQIVKEQLEPIIVALVIAIDCVKAEEAVTNTSTIQP